MCCSHRSQGTPELKLQAEKDSAPPRGQASKPRTHVGFMPCSRIPFAAIAAVRVCNWAGSRASQRKLPRRITPRKAALSRSSAEHSQSFSQVWTFMAFLHTCARCGARAGGLTSPSGARPGPSFTAGCPVLGAPSLLAPALIEVEVVAVGEGCPHAGLLSVCVAEMCEV